jgi:hypothetical protein
MELSLTKWKNLSNYEMMQKIEALTSSIDKKKHMIGEIQPVVANTLQVMCKKIVLMCKMQTLLTAIQIFCRISMDHPIQVYYFKNLI